MSNILDIPQIQGFQLDILQNDLHIGFTGDIAKRLQKLRWADEAHTLKVFPEAVDALSSHGDRHLGHSSHHTQVPVPVTTQTFCK